MELDSREQARLKEEGALVSAAYLLLLKLPYGTSRDRLQAVLASLRDEVARLEGREAEDVQNEFEDRAFALQAEGGSS